MKILVSISGDLDANLRDLNRWLQLEARLRSAGTPRLVNAATPGELGSSFDFIQFVAGSLIDLTALFVSIAAWRDARRTKETVELQANGRTVRLETSDPDKAADLARDLWVEGEE